MKKKKNIDKDYKLLKTSIFDTTEPITTFKITHKTEPLFKFIWRIKKKNNWLVNCIPLDGQEDLGNPIVRIFSRHSFRVCTPFNSMCMDLDIIIQWLMKNIASSWGYRENILCFRIYAKLTSFHYHQLLSFVFSTWVFFHLTFTNQTTARKGIAQF